MNEAKTGAKIRAEAAKIVNAVVNDGRSLDAALDSAESFIRHADAAFMRNLCFGTIRHHWQLNAWLEQLLNKRLRSRDSVIHALLCIGLFQMAFLRVPDHAAVSMTVEAARMLRQPKFASLINAVLRNFRRNEIENVESSSDEARFNHPAWFISQLMADWPQHWQQILEANNARAPMFIRVNNARQSTSAYLKELSAIEETPSEKVMGIESAIRLAKPLAVEELPGFADGRASVQDGAAQLAALWLGASDGERILDACAAPGGKTGHLLELAGPSSTLTAIDSDSQRLQRVADNLKRLQFDATLVHADASNPKAWWDGEPFDRILVDAPCSASGVIRRHPDIKLLRRASDIAQFQAQQSALLNGLWPLLRPGGRMLYVTCSVLAAENDAVVDAFLTASDDAAEIRLLPNNNIRDLMQEKERGYQLLPGNRDLDGFYFAQLEKAS